MKGDAAAALTEFRAQYDVGADPAPVLTDLAEFNHLVTRLRFVPAAADDASLSEDERRRGARLRRDSCRCACCRATWQMLLKGIPEVQASNRPVSAAEMVLIRLAHAADLPTLDEALKSLGDAPQPAGGAPRPAVRRRRRRRRATARSAVAQGAHAGDARRRPDDAAGRAPRRAGRDAGRCAAAAGRRSRRRPCR